MHGRVLAALALEEGSILRQFFHRVDVVLCSGDCDGSPSDFGHQHAPEEFTD